MTTSADIRAEAEIRNLERWGQKDFPGELERARIDRERKTRLEVSYSVSDR